MTALRVDRLTEDQVEQAVRVLQGMRTMRLGRPHRPSTRYAVAVTVHPLAFGQRQIVINPVVARVVERAYVAGRGG